MASKQPTGRRAQICNLFIDLYAYRQRENKNPLEDWLTECLAATLRALPAPTKAIFFSDFAGLALSDLNVSSFTHKIEVFTQYPADAGNRPDMLIQLDGQPWIIFENKVSHGVAYDRRDDGAERHQLLRYGDWLNEHGRDCPRKKALVFITHITAPPHDFRSVDHAGLYHGLTRTSASWGEVGRRIAQLTSSLPDDHHARAMVAAFLTYLEDQNMSNEFPTSTAFAAAEVYVGQAAALENLVNRMWNELKGTVNFGGTADFLIKALPDEGSVSAWRYVAPGPASPSGNSYLQTGIWYPETGSWFDADDIVRELRGPQVYVFFGTGDDDMFIRANGELDGFMRPNTDFLACKAITEFSSEPQARGEEIITWVGDRGRTLGSFLASQKLIP